MAISAISSNDFNIPAIRVIFGPSQGNVRTSESQQENSQRDKGSRKVEGDRVVISEDARKALQQDQESKVEKKSLLPGQELDAQEERKVEKLKNRDAQVKRHEMAHKMAGGTVTGQIVYEYTTGPDGTRYATGGHISIDTSTESTPEATVRKAATIRRAALAPSDPSPADRRVAQQAQRMATKARQEISEEQRKEMAEQMSKFNAGSGGGVNIEVDFEKILGGLKNVENPLEQGTEESGTNINRIFKTENQIKAAFKANSGDQEQTQQSTKTKAQDIKIGTSVPSKDRLTQSEEEIQEEVVPEVSPVE